MNVKINGQINGLAKRLGPGLITGAADDDPSGIATYSQIGSQFRFGLVWTLLLTTPLMIGIQMLSARIGWVTGEGLAANIAKMCPRWLTLALDYDDGPWTLRAARFAEPRLPNGLALDDDLLRHFGDQIELVHTRDHAKGGIGVDAEQQLATDLGVFARAMRAGGKTETEAFTESDASLSMGLALKGGRWSRGKDVVGLAVDADAISSARRQYLERGGLTSFLGDGALRCGRERMAELYYSAELGAGFVLSADVQRVANPGYNKDRGPVSFYALRLHWES